MPIILAIVCFILIVLFLFSDFAIRAIQYQPINDGFCMLFSKKYAQMLPKVMFEEQLTATKYKCQPDKINSSAQ
jgi:hypothetical protein